MCIHECILCIYVTNCAMKKLQDMTLHQHLFLCLWMFLPRSSHQAPMQASARTKQLQKAESTIIAQAPWALQRHRVHSHPSVQVPYLFQLKLEHSGVQQHLHQHGLGWPPCLLCAFSKRTIRPDKKSKWRWQIMPGPFLHTTVAFPLWKSCGHGTPEAEHWDAMGCIGGFIMVYHGYLLKRHIWNRGNML